MSGGKLWLYIITVYFIVDNFFSLQKITECTFKERQWLMGPSLNAFLLIKWQHWSSIFIKGLKPYSNGNCFSWGRKVILTFTGASWWFLIAGWLQNVGVFLPPPAKISQLIFFFFFWISTKFMLCVNLQ